ncbi:hypothetical protein MUY27_02980 [Mucilaginibacter sp. RS28]|uniref:Uncharacterized protein n=1 Tax=Mucilaginibacter straminoryzae TaxID=2932774 RepID=A0A9X1X1N2_9SPHI|nr:hypothetical protein [Mucilaginibacter straminoryzae]MCJ8208655.1 hypothetical protein [Mucilaginibacter straminoryzae]
MAAQGLSLPFGISPVNPVAIDERSLKKTTTSGTDTSVPYASAAEACSLIPTALRYQGLLVVAYLSEVATMYWWRDGITDNQLVVFNEIADQATIQNEITTNDNAIVTPKKFWLGIARFLGIDRIVSGNWTFTGSTTLNGFTNTGANPTLLRKTAGAGASSGLLVDTYAAPNAAAYILDLRATNSSDPSAYNQYTFVGATNPTGGGNNIFTKILQGKNGTIAELSDITEETATTIINKIGDGNGKIAATYLPSYVDDVLEYANLAAFPATGETGKIYTAINTNKIYRWSGSVYVEISASPGSTDSVTEGATNLYFTSARVLAVVLTGLAAVTGNITPTDSILAAFGKVQNLITNIAATIRGTALTGLDLSSATPITALDTVLTAPGKLQAQITANGTTIGTKLTGTAATDAETQISAVVTEDYKFVSRLKLFNWLAWRLQQAWTFIGNVTFSGAVKINYFTGATERVVTADAANQLQANYTIVSPYVTDTDIVAAISAATFNSTNKYTASITPANSKVMPRGYIYYIPGTKYEAIDDNVVVRINFS